MTDHHLGWFRNDLGCWSRLSHRGLGLFQTRRGVGDGGAHKFPDVLGTVRLFSGPSFRSKEGFAISAEKGLASLLETVEPRVDFGVNGCFAHAAVLGLTPRIDDDVARRGTDGVMPDLHRIGEVDPWRLWFH